MSYSTIQPPFTLVFREMPKSVLKEYNDWFHGISPSRIQILSSTIKTTIGYEKWEPDFSPNSLNDLGEWFSHEVTTRSRTTEEISEIENQSQFPIFVPDSELTNRTFSLSMDIGMYISQVFLKNNRSIGWSQPFGNKKSIDYGQPVLIGFSTGPFNPVHMIVTLAYGLVSQAKTGKTLRDLYNIWSNLTSAADAADSPPQAPRG